jgi:hypothetical protein
MNLAAAAAWKRNCDFDYESYLFRPPQIWDRHFNEAEQPQLDLRAVTR